MVPQLDISSGQRLSNIAGSRDPNFARPQDDKAQSVVISSSKAVLNLWVAVDRGMGGRDACSETLEKNVDFSSLISRRRIATDCSSVPPKEIS